MIERERNRNFGLRDEKCKIDKLGTNAMMYDIHATTTDRGFY